MITANPYPTRRRHMVSDQLVRRGIQDERVLDTMGKVAREKFVPPQLRGAAYYDQPLPIGEGQTISQPYIVAAMTEALRLSGHEKVLEVGTGSGYGAAVLACIANEVYTIERIPALAEQAREALTRAGYSTVHVIKGDGSLGWLPEAPYDAIVVTAEGPCIPHSLRNQLKPGGRLVMPVCNCQFEHALVRLTRAAIGPDPVEQLEPVRFVPLIGVEGWSPDRSSPLDPAGLHEGRRASEQQRR